MPTAKVYGFEISGADYRAFRSAASIRKALLSYHWVEDSVPAFKPIIFYVRNDDASDLDFSELTLTLTTPVLLEPPMGLSTFHFRNFGGNNQFHNLVRDAIRTYNQNNTPNVQLRNIYKIGFTPAIVASEPNEDPHRFLTLMMEVHFMISEQAQVEMLASASGMVKTVAVYYHPSPPAKPDSVE